MIQKPGGAELVDERRHLFRQQAQLGGCADRIEQETSSRVLFFAFAMRCHQGSIAKAHLREYGG